MRGISFVEPGLRATLFPVQISSSGRPVSQKEYTGSLVFGEEKMNVTSRNEMFIGGLMIFPTESYTLVSKLVFVSWNNATGKWTSCCKFPEKRAFVPENKPFVLRENFGTSIWDDAAVRDPLMTEIASDKLNMIDARIVVDGCQRCGSLAARQWRAV